MWVGNLQAAISLSTTNSEYIALSMDLVTEIGTTFGLQVGDLSNMHVRVHEENAGTLTLGNLKPRRMTLHSKHYTLKYH